jgi:hypothetical protein
VASIAEKRAWLRDNTTEDIPARGVLRPDLLALYDRAHPEGQHSVFAADPAPDDDPWDILPGALDADFIDAADLEPAVPLEQERAPRTQRAARAERRAATPPAARAGRLAGRLLGGGDKSKPGPKGKRPAPRMSLEKFTSRMYSSIGRMCAVISQPMSNCIQAQASMAGVIMEDVARGTIVDRLLQPAARAEDKLDKVFALVAPPLIVLGIEQAAALPPQQAMMRQAFLMPILRESLRVGLEVSEQYADRLTARVKEDQARDAQIDDLIGLIFAMPPQPETAAAAEPAMA